MFSILTVAALFAVISFGIPVVVKFAAFLTELGSSGKPVAANDSTPPPPPTVDSLPSSTNSENLAIKGTTEPGATVTLSVNGRKEEVIANSEGDFNFTFKLVSGENTVFVTSKDTSGNESQKTQNFRIVLDKNPPDIVITKPADGSEFYGASQRRITVEGETEKEANLRINGRFVVVNDNGKFAFPLSLADGENKLEITGEDEAGNKTEKTLVLKFNP